MRFDRLALGLALGLGAAPVLAETSLSEAAARLDLYPCQLSNLSCVNVMVPLDHRANDPSVTLEITYALSFARVESRGMLAFFVGGPGGSGLAAAEGYLAAFDQSLSDYMDIIFVDQRGIGPAHGLSCPQAQAQFDIAPVSLENPQAALTAAETYARDCTAELQADRLLPVVATDQAIRDFEIFRSMIGGPKLWLYGESYGTQVVQAYATAYPQAVRGVILDGVVDLTLDAPGFYAAYTVAAERILARTFAACADIPACAADMGQDAAKAYDSLASQLVSGPLAVDFVQSDGTTVQRPFTSTMLDSNAFYALYSPEGRAEFLRALAAYQRGNALPLLHLAYANLYLDPETESALDDPGWFPAAFYAITCTDYDSGPGATPRERAAAIIEEARAFAPQAPRLLRSYYMERIACAFWPHQGPATRPEPYAGGDWPTLVLNSDADPITPISMAWSVLDNARNAYGVFLQGGPHVIWGRGLPCPDRIVQDLLYDGRLPEAREQLCEQDFIAPYAPLTLTNPDLMADPLTVARAVEAELYQMIPLAAWDGATPLTLGCDHGGKLTVRPTYQGTDYRFADCRFWPDLSISGQGSEISLGDDSDGFILRLTVSGPQDGEITYRYRTRDEAYSISGTWNGKPAEVPRSIP
jgi:pimeloyl-ACP methyl ester carboxylesterase